MNRASQSGNVIVIILIGIVLFAALSLAVNRGMNLGTYTGNDQKMDLEIDQILNFGNAIKVAVQSLLIDGCTDTQITFEENNNTSYKTSTGGAYDYTNPNAPTDKRCHIFNINGGGVTPRKFSPDFKLAESAIPAFWMHPQSWSAITMRVIGVGTETGTAGTDLAVAIGFVTKDMCKRINDRLGIVNPSGNPPIDPYASAKFIGSYAAHVSAIGDVTGLIGKTSFCSSDGGGSGYYTYYQILIAR